MAKKMLVQYDLGFASDKGIEKQINEDNYCAEHWESEDGVSMGLVAISDGLGGFSFGEIASKIAINQMEKFFKLGEFQQMFEEADFIEPERVIQELYTRINHVVMTLSEQERRKIGCTLVSGFMMQDKVYLANAGNSRAYLIRNGTIKRLTDDKGGGYSLESSELGITAADDITGERNNKFKNTLGSDFSLRPDIKSFEAEGDDILIFCTDGLYGQIPEMEIMNSAKRHSDNMQRVCNELVEKVNKAGGEDNVTVVAIKFITNKKKPILKAINKYLIPDTPITPNQAKKTYPIIIGLIIIIFILGFLIMGKLIFRNTGGLSIPAISKHGIIPNSNTGVYNSLTLETTIPLNKIEVNNETRALDENSWTFVFDNNTNEVEISPNLYKLRPKLYAITLEGLNRNLSVVQATKNKVIVKPDTVIVHLTTDSQIDYIAKPDYTGNRFVLRINNLGSPFTIVMESQENIFAEVTHDTGKRGRPDRIKRINNSVQDQ